MLTNSQLRHEANLTIKILNEACGDKFTPTFITRVDDPLYRFDYLFRYEFNPTVRNINN